MSQGISFYLHVHQPRRVREYSVFDIGEQHNYFDVFDDTDLNDEKIFHRVAEKSYRPMTALLQKFIYSKPEFRV
jgi:alpha-amylase